MQVKFENLDEFKYCPESKPKRLSEIMADVQEPYCGLQHIHEILSYTRRDVEPHYKCTLCKTEGKALEMKTHLLDQNHLIKAFDEKKNDKNNNIHSMLLEDLKENGQFNLVKTIHSDEMYPWPVGM